MLNNVRNSVFIGYNILTIIIPMDIDKVYFMKEEFNKVILDTLFIIKKGYSFSYFFFKISRI